MKTKTVTFDLLVHLRGGGSHPVSYQGTGETMTDKFRSVTKQIRANYPNAAWVQVKGMRPVEDEPASFWKRIGVDVRGEG